MATIRTCPEFMLDTVFKEDKVTSAQLSWVAKEAWQEQDHIIKTLEDTNAKLRLDLAEQVQRTNVVMKRCEEVNKKIGYKNNIILLTSIC